MLPADVAAQVMDSSRRFAQQCATTSAQRDVFDTALRGLATWEGGPGWVFFLHLPLLVHGAISGDPDPAMPVARATTLLYLGMDILDDLADGDESEHWAGHAPAEINLVGITFVAALPQLAILEADVPADRLVVLQRTIAVAGLRMSAGQQLDLGQAGAGELTAAEVAAAAAGKTGEQCALFARLAAELAGAPARVVASYAQMAHAYGMALQVLEDCHTLFERPRSRDLSSGIRSFPIAWQLQRLVGRERDRFVDLLDQARADEDAQEQVRRELKEGGGLRASAITSELYCARARQALAAVSPREPAGADLRAMIDAKSWFTHEDRAELV